MPKTLVLFSSRTGHTAALADALADGASSVRFAEVDVRWLPNLALAEATESDARRVAIEEALAKKYRPLAEVERVADYDALVVGTSTRNGVMAAEVEHFLRQAGSLFAEGKLRDRAGSAFTSVPEGGGGAESTLWSIMKPMAALGMLLVAPGSAGRGASASGHEYGAVSIGDAGPDAAALDAARYQGKRVAQVAAMLAHVRSHQHHH